MNVQVLESRWMIERAEELFKNDLERDRMDQISDTTDGGIRPGGKSSR
jgi:hypothetical protein